MYRRLYQEEVNRKSKILVQSNCFRHYIMNIVLLILGVFLIIISIILITLNPSSTYESSLKVESEKEFDVPDMPLKKFVQNEYKDDFVVDFQEDYFEKEITELKNVKDISVEDLDEFEEEYKPSRPVAQNNEENVTDEIIKMYKEGFKSNEIAKELNKGIREIEIILKINNINN